MTLMSLDTVGFARVRALTASLVLAALAVRHSTVQALPVEPLAALEWHSRANMTYPAAAATRFADLAHVHDVALLVPSFLSLRLSKQLTDVPLAKLLKMELWCCRSRHCSPGQARRSETHCPGCQAGTRMSRPPPYFLKRGLLEVELQLKTLKNRIIHMGGSSVADWALAWDTASSAHTKVLANVTGLYFIVNFWQAWNQFNSTTPWVVKSTQRTTHYAQLDADALGILLFLHHLDRSLPPNLARDKLDAWDWTRNWRAHSFTSSSLSPS